MPTIEAFDLAEERKMRPATLTLIVRRDGHDLAGLDIPVDQQEQMRRPLAIAATADR